jgi:pyridoxal phosphate enzyme (YggS family)
MVGPSVKQRLEDIRQRLERARAKAGRAAGSVHLLAVSKLHSSDKIRQALSLGQIDFAENYVQEAVQKVAEFGDLSVRWHFIGRIQSNKLKFLVNGFAVIHSVDRLSIAEGLERLLKPMGKRQDIFLQFNVAAEDSKGGQSASGVTELALSVMRTCPHLRVLGLMVMPPLTDNAEQVRPLFRQAKILCDDLRAMLSLEQQKLHPMDQLSMGTSHDFEVAIEEGATWVRIGTDIFGARAEPAEEKT